MDVIDKVKLGAWYHIVITMEPTNYNNFEARWKSYVNSYTTNTLENGWLPRGIVRNSALIGKSNVVSDSQMSAKIDAIRVYDYLVSETEAEILYDLVHDSSAIPAPRLSSSSSSSTGSARSSSSSARFSSSSASIRSSSSSKRVVKEYCSDVADTDQLEGYWPNCFCADDYPDCDVDCLMYPDDSGCDKPVRSSTGAAAPAGSSNSVGTAAVIGIVFAIIVGLAAVGYLYMRYCRSGPSTEQSNVDGKASLLGDTRIGVERDNAYTQWVPPSGAVPMSSLPSDTQTTHQTI